MSAIQSVVMPRWGLTMEDGTITQWLFQPGDVIEIGQDIVEVESTKLAGTVEATAAGILRRIIIPQGDNVPVGALIGMIADAGVTDEELDEYAASFTPIESGEEEIDAPAMAAVDVRGTSVSYLKMGSGSEIVLLIHGFGGDVSGWGMLQQTLSADFETIAINLPGHGASSKEIADGSLSGQANVVAAFLSELGIGPVHIVAHSMGGGVALALALTEPARIASLTLLAPAGLGREINADYLDTFIAAGKRRQVEQVLHQLFADESFVSRSLAEDVLAYKRLDGVEAALRTIRSAFLDDQISQARVMREDLARIAVPVTILWGLSDRIIPPSHADGIDTSIDVRRLEGVGHMPQVEAPAIVATAVKATIARAGDK